MHQVIVPTEDDFRAIRQKIARSTTLAEMTRYEQELEMLEDAAVIYKLNHPRENNHSTPQET